MDYTSIKVGQLPSAAIAGSNLIPHEVGGLLKKATISDLAAFISANGAVGFRAVSVPNGGTLPATTQQEFILVGPGTYNNVGGGSPVTVTEELNALVSNGTFWFIGVQIPIDPVAAGTATWGQIGGNLPDQPDLQTALNAKQNQLNGTGFIKISGTTVSYDNNTYALDSAVVKVTTDQNIRGVKTFLGNQTGTTLKLVLADYFNDGLIESDSGLIKLLNGTTELFKVNKFGEVTANSFIKSGGLFTQFLMADGSVDSSTYALDNAVVKLTGNQTIAGAKTFSNGIVSNNTSTGDGLLINNSGARALNILNTSGSSFGLLINNDNLTSVNTITTQKQGYTVFRINDSGGGYFAGNVGIGTTSVSSGDNQRVLEVNAPLYSTIRNQSQGVILTSTANSQNGWGAVGTESNHHLTFFSNSAERMRITSGGNVGIGTTVLRSRLQIGTLGVYTGGSNYTFAMSNGSTDFLITLNEGQQGSSTTFYSSTDYFFNRSGPGSSGIITAYGFNNISDYRLKYDLESFNGLDIVNQMKTYKYKMSDNHEVQYGVLAHEIQEILPHLVVGEKDGDRLQSVDYQKMVPMLIKAIQELQQQINELKK